MSNRSLGGKLDGAFFLAVETGNSAWNVRRGFATGAADARTRRRGIPESLPVKEDEN